MEVRKTADRGVQAERLLASAHRILAHTARTLLLACEQSMSMQGSGPRSVGPT
jgi:hypothetical protein